ncbi:MAG TPA: hypothetical protein VGL62_01620 [Vicinamibacterales bacterium]|jgi:hypothetical protein
MTTRGLIVVGLLSGMAATACGSSAPAAPAPVFQSTATIPDAFNIAGNWSGTIQSNNLPTRTITMTIVQTSSCVDGAWKDAAGQWTGAISGWATTDSFSGQISFERTADGGGTCSAVGNAEGAIGNDGIHWTVDAFTSSGACAGDLPQSTVITLQHQS